MRYMNEVAKSKAMIETSDLLQASCCPNNQIEGFGVLKEG